MLDIEALTQKMHDRKAAILFVDMQLGYVRHVHGSTKMLNGVEDLLEMAAGKVECIHIGCGINKQKPSHGDVLLKNKNPFINDTLNSLSSIFLYMIPEGHSICLKDRYTANGFDNTGLKEYLDDKGIDTVVVCGVYDDLCVRDTGEGAQKLGLNVVYLSDLIRGLSISFVGKDAAEQLAIHQGMFSNSGLVIEGSDLKPMLDVMPTRTGHSHAIRHGKPEPLVPTTN